MSRIEQIVDEFKDEVHEFLAGYDMDDALYLLLHDHYFDQMPYSYQTGDADTYEWIHNKFYEDVKELFPIEL